MVQINIGSLFLVSFVSFVSFVRFIRLILCGIGLFILVLVLTTAPGEGNTHGEHESQHEERCENLLEHRKSILSSEENKLSETTNCLDA